MRAAEWLLERDAVHVLATDAHDTKHRPPSLSAARDKVAKLYGQEVAQALVDDNPRAIISDKPLPYFPNPVMKKSTGTSDLGLGLQIVRCFSAFGCPEDELAACASWIAAFGSRRSNGTSLRSEGLNSEV